VFEVDTREAQRLGLEPEFVLHKTMSGQKVKSFLALLLGPMCCINTWIIWVRCSVLYPPWCVNRFFHRGASSIRLTPHAWMLLEHGETACTTWRFYVPPEALFFTGFIVEGGGGIMRRTIRHRFRCCYHVSYVDSIHTLSIHENM
jgi:hypothetical protein